MLFQYLLAKLEANSEISPGSNDDNHDLDQGVPSEYATADEIREESITDSLDQGVRL